MEKNNYKTKKFITYLETIAANLTCDQVPERQKFIEVLEAVYDGNYVLASIMAKLHGWGILSQQIRKTFKINKI